MTNATFLVCTLVFQCCRGTRSLAGVFKETVKWCLIVTTKEEAMICAMARNDPPAAQGPSWEIGRTSFVVPSDWVSFLCVASTKGGRVFLGGQDGSLYELDYDVLTHPSRFHDGGATETSSGGQSIRQQLDRFYDASDDPAGGPAASTACPNVLVDNSISSSWSASDRILQTGKRVLEATLPGTRFGGSASGRRSKCRKLNHSHSSVIASIVPEFISKVADAVFGDTSTTGGGAITQIVIDEERQILYTLSSPRGWICAMDLVGPSNPSIDSAASSSASTTAPPLTVAAIVDAPATARTYLEAVSRGRLYPPSTPSSSRLGMLSFLGNGDAAQAGVGGMEGARRILKVLEATKVAQGNNRPGSRGSQQQDASILTPVSIQVVPNQESTRITLLAITSGGLRYYLSTMNQQTMGAGPSTPPFGTPRNKHPWKPSSRFTLCHVRAPPPLATNEPQSSGMSYVDSSNGMVPAVLKNWKVDACCYRLGAFIVALEPTGPASDGTPRNEDLLVAATADCAARIVKKTYGSGETKPSVSYLAPGGVIELVSFAASSSGDDDDGVPHQQAVTLSGGRVWEIEPATLVEGRVLTLALHSKTPSDTELGLTVPPYAATNFIAQSSASSAAQRVSSEGALLNHSNSLVGFRVVTNILLGRLPRYGIDVRPPVVPQLRTEPLYRISKHSGSDGYSLSAADVVSTGRKAVSVARSERLSPWLLDPAVIPLHPLALQHLQPQESTFLALNIGGIHSFQSISLMGRLSNSILAAGTNVRSDATVTKFFQEYGFTEGCAMCLMLAIKSNNSHELRELALRAALHRAYRPRLVRVDDSGNGQVANSASIQYQRKQDDWVPPGYSLKLSSLCEGLYLTLARLLRPIWYKPAVIVTEGRIIRRGETKTTSPSKVELLLEDDTLEEIRRPLFALESLVRRVFQKAIESVPLKIGKLGQTNSDPMEIEGDDSFFQTRSIQFLRQGQGNGFGFSNPLMTDSDAEELAQHIEERNIHSLYRLLSRTTQLLSLLSNLRRAQAIPDLPDVEWGVLHGLQVMKLVQTLDGQERIENLLNKLVTSSQTTTVLAESFAAADANQIADLLAQQCYHYFSPGTHYAFLGFRAAQEALCLPPGQSRRAVRMKQAIVYLNEAAKNWYSCSLITGRVLRADKTENYEEIALRAMRYNSPLAKACSFLVELGDAASVVSLCLQTAENFLGAGKSGRNYFEVGDSFDQLSWEKGLYHKRHDLSNEFPSRSQSAMVQGSDVTRQDAVNTCYSLVFYYLTRFLDAKEQRMGEEMVSACAFSSNHTFLDAFYEHMLSSNRKDILLRVKSPFLEKWLTKKEKDDHELLLFYYRIQGMSKEEADEAFKLATSFEYPEKHFTIQERICFLQTADTSYSEALASGYRIHSDSGTDILLTQRIVSGRLEIAKLQADILEAMKSTKYDVGEEPINLLKWSLLDASKLLNDFAIPYDLYEICLLILQACRHQQADVTQMLWKNLICGEIFPCETNNEFVYQRLGEFAAGSDFSDSLNVLHSTATSSSNTFSLFESGMWIPKLKATVIGVGQRLFTNDFAFVFPIDFIACCLEGKFKSNLCWKTILDLCPGHFATAPSVSPECLPLSCCNVELRSIYCIAARPGDLTIGPEWIFSIFISVGISFKVSFDACSAAIEWGNHGNSGGHNPIHRLNTLDAFVSMFEIFVQTALAGTPSVSQNDSLLEVLAEIERVMVQLQTVPENVVSLENRLQFVEQEIRNLTQQF